MIHRVDKKIHERHNPSWKACFPHALVVNFLTSSKSVWRFYTDFPLTRSIHWRYHTARELQSIFISIAREFQSMFKSLLRTHLAIPTSSYSETFSLILSIINPNFIVFQSLLFMYFLVAKKSKWYTYFKISSKFHYIYITFQLLSSTLFRTFPFRPLATFNFNITTSKLLHQVSLMNRTTSL